MVLFGKWQNRSLTISSKPNCLTVSLQQDAGATVFSYDAAGRLWTAMLAGVSYRRGLDGKIVAKWGATPESRQRRWLEAGEARALEETARDLAYRLQLDMHGGPVELNGVLDQIGTEFIANAGSFSESAYATDIARYHQVYKPVGILPPDQYMAVVLQATEGCSFNTCTFCNFYRDRPFRIKTPESFREHVRAVAAFLGEGMSLRRTIFLGDANALVIPMPRLLPLLDIIHEDLDVEALGGIYAFLDGFSGERKSAADFAALARRGLKRVYVGMESGSARLLQFLKKPGNPDDVIAAVRNMKSAGVAVGIIVLLGAGGQAYAREHVVDTIAAINAMGLDLDDIVYFSELIESEGLEYTRDAFDARLQPLTPQERLRQAEQIERALVFSEEGGTPHISRYDIREFVY